MEALDELIARRVTQVRQGFAETQAEFSERLHAGGLHWSQGTLSKVESALRPVRLAEAVLLSRILDMPLQEFVAPTEVLARLREDGDRRLANRVKASVAAQKESRSAALYVLALALFEELRDGRGAERGELEVVGCSAVALLDFIAARTPEPRDKLFAGLLVALGEEDVVEDERLNARAAIEAWARDEEAVPYALGEEYPISPLPVGMTPRDMLMGRYAAAADGDEDEAWALEREIFSLQARRALEAYLLIHVAFTSPRGSEPFNIRGVRGAAEAELVMRDTMMLDALGDAS